MGHSDFDPAARDRHPWNVGLIVGTKRPLRPRDIWAIRFFLDEHERIRDRALFNLAIDSKLRGCDLVSLKVGDVQSAGMIRNRATMVQAGGKPMDRQRAKYTVFATQNGARKRTFAGMWTTDRR